MPDPVLPLREVAPWIGRTGLEVAADVARVISLGATHIHDKDEFGMHWTTLADPEGNEFCIGTLPTAQGTDKAEHRRRRFFCTGVRSRPLRQCRNGWSRGDMTTAHSSTTSATTHDLGSRRAAGRSGRLVRLTASVTAVVVIGTAAGIAVDRATATGTGTGPTIAVPDTSVGVVFSAAAQTAGVRAADDATTKAYRDPLGAVLFGTSWAAPSVAPDPLAALLFGTHWPLVATFGADQPQVDLTDQTSH